MSLFYIQRRPIGVGLFGSSLASSSNSKVQELEKELLETRLLYSCTLDDMDIVSTVCVHNKLVLYLLSLDHTLHVVGLLVS